MWREISVAVRRRNFATSGQIYTTILERERRGGYLGRDVQMIPHVTGSVKMRLPGRRSRPSSWPPSALQS